MLDLLITWLPIIGGAFLAVGLSMYFGGGNRSHAIWVNCVGAILMAVGFSLHLQKHVWDSVVADPKGISDTEFLRDRAYIDVTWERILDYRVDSQIGAEVVIKNVGNTPAFKLKTKTTIGIRRHPLDSNADWTQADIPMTESTLFRGQSVRSHTKLSVPLPAEFFDQIVKGEKFRLYVWGISTFETLGRGRYQKFCFVIYGPRDQLAHPEICDQHNDGD